MNFTRITNDTNGNPRYVVHFLECEPEQWKDYTLTLSERYARTCRLMNRIGGRKYHTKSYGGGIVFVSFNTDETEKRTNELKEKAQ